MAEIKNIHKIVYYHRKQAGLSRKELAELADIEIRVPHIGFADRIQEIHIKVIHILIQLIEKHTLDSQ